VSGPFARSAVLLTSALSVAIAALGTVAPFGGDAGESGFAFGVAEFAALYRRAPVQAALDIVLLIVLLVFVLRIVDRALGTARASTAVPRRV
jgi:uncharacterized membrane protein